MKLQDDLLLDTCWEEIIPSYINKYKNSKLIIFGTGGGSDLVYRLLEENKMNQNVEFFMDSNESQIGKRKFGCKVVSPSIFVQEHKELNNYKIIIGSMFLNSIKIKLINLGFDASNLDTRIFGMAKDYFNYNNVKLIVDENLTQFNEVYELLGDEFSKKVFVGLINSKITLDNEHLKNISSESKMQYFEKDLIQLTEHEVFVDCGSYDGDTLDIFQDLTQGNYQKYIAIEADPTTYKQLNKNIVDKKYKKVETYNKACWHEETTLYFESNLTAGHINEAGGIQISAGKLDDILVDEKITFIKMDIEGAEENALLGAERIIREQKPILAICIYHNLNDYYKLPLLMKKFNEEYDFYVRHYTEMVDQETVCYAIPKNRMIV